MSDVKKLVADLHKLIPTIYEHWPLAGRKVKDAADMLEAMTAKPVWPREAMIEAVLRAHEERSWLTMPSENKEAVRKEIETYRPYAAADVDAIIKALAKEQP